MFLWHTDHPMPMIQGMTHLLNAIGFFLAEELNNPRV